jgi:hypothetical protein
MTFPIKTVVLSPEDIFKAVAAIDEEFNHHLPPEAKIEIFRTVLFSQRPKSMFAPCKGGSPPV